MPEPYTAVGLIPTVRGIRTRAEIQRNLDHIAQLFKAASWLSSLDLPVRLVAIPEGALQGFNDEVLDLDHVTYARECAIDIPGPETASSATSPSQLERVHHGPGQGAPRGVPRPLLQRRLRHRPAAARSILKHYKLATLYPVEHSMTPHDVWDRWIELYGRDARRLLPGRRHGDRPPGRADGQRGLLPGERPRPGDERRRGRLPRLLPAPAHRQRVLRDPEPRPRAGQQLLRRRPQPGAPTTWTPTPTTPIDTFGGRSMVVDYKGRIVGQHAVRRRLVLRGRARSTSRRCATSAPTRSGTTGSRTCAPSCTSSSTSSRSTRRTSTWTARRTPTPSSASR